MSFRLFKTRKGNSMADLIKKKCDRETTKIENTVYNIPNLGIVKEYDECYKITQPYTNIKYSTGDYTVLRKYRTIYNNRKLDENRKPIQFFNGEMNSSMYLEKSNTQSSTSTQNICDNQYKNYIYKQIDIPDKEEKILCEKTVMRELPDRDWNTFQIQ